MCGFTGFIGAAIAREDAVRQLEAMNDAIRHRGPDSSGLWIDAEAGFAVAHRRLSIIDVSAAGHQPMVSQSGRWIIAFNGEIYNFADIRRDLERSGAAPAWRGSSDTEVLLAAIDAWGIQRAIEASAGMFALALWDRDTRVLTLARDRLGEKPLYYGQQGAAFLFGSDLSALRRHVSWQDDISRDAVALLLRHGYIPAPHSIYRGISKLQPGAMLGISSGGTVQNFAQYWRAQDKMDDARRIPFDGSADDALAEAERLFARAVESQMISDVPLGAFLSGGIDSTLVTATMQRLSSRPVKTFTIGFEDASYDEAQNAAAVAQHLGTEHTSLTVTNREMLDTIPKLSGIYSEPFADASQIPTYLVSRMARADVTVALSGDGGDEVFSGYDRYRFADRYWPTLSRIPHAARRVTALGLQRIPLAAMSAGGSRFAERGKKIANVLSARTADEVYSNATMQWPDSPSAVLGVTEHFWPRAGDEISDGDPVRGMMLADLTGYLPDDILAKVDRAAMAVSLETRMPFLDHRLVEFSFGLPLSILRRDGQSKWITRELLARHVPRALFERPKQGFSVPLSEWLQGPLRPWADALLTPERLKREGFFDADIITHAWLALSRGWRGNAHAIWTVLMFQLWLETEHGGQA
ncbi:asparagine synthase (glutamine-hydrolyzing) [Hyphomicrobium methylovorum]|uniref:asparagine synthase (glutamine-hydrolyzing) n=1 Tax=Hyphomicrobium methylovorum TaxID=84 RepID=UPI0015E7A566|nr:asparagine synthase (glutamine-hydrolyzing) [Hyphomicrobium methylovorum]MBA2125972.1 asparagine synthase (glutamine-hydrolyzing) [Hyphomicrobium methylovorum]